MKQLENVDAKFIEQYIRKGKRRPKFETTVDIYNHLKFHIDGYSYGEQPENPYFRLLIDDRRPSESVSIKEYRRKIYTSSTKPTCFKVINSLKKIVKSQDWKIDYSKVKPQTRVPEDENMETYCEEKYPIFNSIENWLYSYGLKEILTDPNGACVVMPLSFDVKPNEYLKPFANYIHSDKIYDFQLNHYIVFESNMMSEYKVGDRVVKEPIIVVMDTKSVWYATKTSPNIEYVVEHMYDHNIGKLPAFLGGGIYKEIIDETPLFDSFMSPMLPSLDVTSRESSDLDAEVVQHIYSTMWYMGGENCSSCAGVGKVKKDGKQVVCPDCKGVGVMQKSPYKDLVIKKSVFEQGNVPAPPAGYINKPTDMVSLQDTRIQNHLTNALSAINMEFLAQTPLNQSGVAKEVDRDELNNFVYGVAYHFVENVLKPIYCYTAEWRYPAVVQNEQSRIDMLPIINVPEKYDLLSEDTLLDNIAKANDSDVDAVIISEMQIDYINKKFRDMPEVRNKLISTNELNPFVGMSATEINDMLLAGIITKKDAVKSIYINEFVDKAVAKDVKFLDKTYEQKMDVIDKMADEKVAQLDKNKGTVITPEPTEPNENE
jgi:hypothetical protein